MGPAQRRLPHGALCARATTSYARNRAVAAPDQRPLYTPPALQHQGDGDGRERARPPYRALPRAESRGGLPLPGTAHRGRAQGSVAGGGRQRDRAACAAEARAAFVGWAKAHSAVPPSTRRIFWWARYALPILPQLRLP